MHTILCSLKGAQGRAPRLATAAFRGLLAPQRRAFAAPAMRQLRAAESAITSDVRATEAANAKRAFAPKQRELSAVPHETTDHVVPDFSVGPDELAIPVLPQTPIKSREEHPFESIAKQYRVQNDPYATLQDNQVLLTNLPTEGGVPELQSPLSVQKMLEDLVHKDLQVKEVKFVKSVSTPNLKEKVAFVRVTLGSTRQAKMVKSALRKTWFKDALIKVKTNEDAKAESFDNRTVILHGIPRHLGATKILDTLFGKAGAVVGVELPTENSKLRELRAHVESQQDSPSSIQKEIARRRAAIAINSQLSEEGELATSAATYETYNTLKQEGKQLENERLSGIFALITQLQAEGKHALLQKLTLLAIKEKAATQVTSSIAEQESLAGSEASDEALRSLIKDNAAELKTALNYLKQNQAEIAMKYEADPLTDLLRLGKEELATAYDQLIEALGHREKAIEERMRLSIQDYSLTDRVLMSGLDYERELEALPDVKKDPMDVAEVETFVGVGQQVHNVLLRKEPDEEERTYRLLTRTLNPFDELNNFDEAQMKATTNPDLQVFKMPYLPDPMKPSSLAKNLFEGSDFNEAIQARAEKHVKEARENLELPQDELYHRQKRLIQEVIDAEAALEKKMASLGDPMEGRELDLDKLDPDQRFAAEQILSRNESPYAAGIRRRRDALTEQRLSQARGELSSYAFDYSETAELQRLVDSGELSVKNKERLQQLIAESQEKNLGYAFVTFSHADEARIFLLENADSYYGFQPIEFSLKTRVDHSEMDLAYFLKRAKNHAQTADEIETIRKSREALRSFERDLDKDFPSRKRLKEFRRFAQSLIDDRWYSTRMDDSFGIPRDEIEQEEFDRKVREFEKQNPDVDLTMIYENEKTEAARRTMHKKAYASYKAFHFLKHGVKQGAEQERKSEKLSSAKQRLRDRDPYNFPEMDASVRAVLSADVDLPQFNDVGDMVTTAGRRLRGYTEQEYVESFFGKDMARRMQTEHVQDPLYRKQQSLKEKYPKNSFLKKPALEKKMKQLEATGLGLDYKKFPALLPKNDKAAVKMALINEGDILLQKHVDKEYNINAPRALWKRPRALANAIDQNIETQKQRKNAFVNDETVYIDRRQLTKDIRVIQERQVHPEPNLSWQEIRSQARNEDDEDESHARFLQIQYDEHMKMLRHESKEDYQYELEHGDDEYVDAKFEPIYKGGKGSDDNIRPKFTEWFGQEPRQEEDLSGAFATTVSREDQEFERSLAHLAPERRQEAIEARQRQKAENEQVLSSLADGQITDELRSIGKAFDDKAIEFKFDGTKARVQSRAEAKKQHLQETKGIDIDFIEDELDMLKNGDPNQRIQLLRQQRRRASLQQAIDTEAGEELSGDWFKKYQTRADTLSETAEYVKATRPGQQLDEFVRDPASVMTGAEDDDDDVFTRYMQMASRLPDQEDSQKDATAGFKLDEKALSPELPRMEEYFRNQAEGVHPFDRVASSFDESEVHGSQEDREAEQERLDRLHHQMLMGKLVGQTLTPEEYEVLMKPKQETGSVLQRVTDNRSEEFFSRRILARLSEEKAEQTRRRKVLDGEWPEEESSELLRAYISQKDDLVNSDEFRKNKNKLLKNLPTLFGYLSQDVLREKEYHFDESVGVSLDEHVAELKAQFPSCQVQIRRDRQGYAIVKILRQQEFKYDIEKILAFDEEEAAASQARVMNTLLKEMSGHEDPAEGFKARSAGEIKELVEGLASLETCEFEPEDELRLQKLSEARLYGSLKDDDQGYITAIKELASEITPVKRTEKLAKSTGSQEALIDALFEDRERLRDEVALQLALRVNHYNDGTRRTLSDFVKRRYSEVGAGAAKAASVDASVTKLEQMTARAQGEKDFDREAFDKMKEELRKRKQLKEDMLSGGLTKFKPYLRI